MNREFLEIYTDYLLSSFGHTTATGLSALLDNSISHDRITRFLSGPTLDSKELWKLVKPSVRSVESDDGVVIFDDTVQEKCWTDENDIICWHFDHSKNRTVKGVNILNCLYNVENIDIPVAFEIVHKPVQFCCIASRKEKRKSEVTKNELMRNMIAVCMNNRLSFKYVLADNWFSSKENMNFIRLDAEKDFIMGLKSNRVIALSKKDKRNGRFIRLNSLELKPGSTRAVYLKGVPFPLLLCRQVFKNKDKSEGVLYLVSSDVRLKYDQIATICQKRWKVETFHKSIKSNAGLAKSPTRTVRTQSNHFFASIYSFFKLEQLKIKHNSNHFALRAKIYLAASKAGFKELQMIAA